MQHLLSMQLFIINPSPSFGLKNLFTLFFKIYEMISYFPGHRYKVSKSGTVTANLGRMACMHYLYKEENLHPDQHQWVFPSFPTILRE